MRKRRDRGTWWVAHITNPVADLLWRRLVACQLNSQRQRDHHVVAHSSINVGTGSRASRFLKALRKKFVAGCAVVGHCVHRNNPLGNFGTHGFNQLRVGSPAWNNPSQLVARLVPLAQNNRGVRQIGTHHNHIWFFSQHFLQLRPVAGTIGFVHHFRHHLATARFPHTLETVGVATARRVVKCHGRRAFKTTLFGDLGKCCTKPVVGGLKTPNQIFFVECRDSRRTRNIHLNQISLVREWHHSQRDARGPGANQRLHLVHFNQLFSCQHTRLWLGLIVLIKGFQLAARRAACRIHVFNRQLNRFLHACAVRRARTGNRVEGANPEHVARLGQHQGRNT